MEMHDFLTQELRTLTIRESKNASNEKKSGEILKQYNSCFGNNHSFEEGIENWSKELKESGAEFSELYKFTINQLTDFGAPDFDKANLERIEQAVKNDPKNLIYPLLWVLQKKASFDADEYLDFEYAQFINKIVEEYDYLVKLDDFFYATDILLIKPIWEEWERDIFLPVLKKASEKYPDKYAFKRIKAFILYKDKDYLAALDALNSIINSIKTELKEKDEKTIGSPDFPYFDYLDAIQLTGIIHFKLGNLSKAMFYVNYVINNLPVIESEGEVEYEILSYIDSFMIRIQNSMRTNNHVQIIKDYKVIKGVLFLYDWESEYPGVYSFIRERKLHID